MSKIEVNTVEPQCGTTLTVGKCTTNLRSGGNNLQAADGGNLISQSGTDITLGASGDTINLASGASQSGFGRTGTVDWITTPKVTGDSPVTGVAGKGYFLNTSAGAITLNLPAGSAGDIISLADYAATWQTNNVTVVPNGSEKIGGANETAILSTIGQSVTFVYVDSTQGWINTMDSTSNVRGAAPYVTASGGNQSPVCGLVCGDYKTHIFTGPGTLCFSSGGTPLGSNTIDYFVVAGGGSGGSNTAGGGAGAGGFRMSNSLGLPAPTNSPLATGTALTVSATGYPIQVGGGAAGIATPCSPAQPNGTPSIFSTITSAGGGGGTNGIQVGVCGGSGGAGKGGAGPSVSNPYPGGTSQPVTSPVQGSAGGAGYDGVHFNTQGGGGGGAGAIGGNAGPGAGAPGGAGSFMDDTFIGPTAPTYGTPGPVSSTRYFAGGGGGSTDTPTAAAYPGGAGGGGIGGNPATPVPTRQGTINTGGGGGAGFTPGGPGCGIQTNGGSGIVMIRYKFQN